MLFKSVSYDKRHKYYRTLPSQAYIRVSESKTHAVLAAITHVSNVTVNVNANVDLAEKYIV